MDLTPALNCLRTLHEIPNVFFSRPFDIKVLLVVAATGELLLMSIY
jgi:hypothetical protein